METKEMFKEYKEKICPYCIHSDDENYQDCNIVMQIDGQANCINYKCKEYLKKGKQK